MSEAILGPKTIFFHVVSPPLTYSVMLILYFMNPPQDGADGQSTWQNIKEGGTQSPPLRTAVDTEQFGKLQESERYSIRVSGTKTFHPKLSSSCIGGRQDSPLLYEGRGGGGGGGRRAAQHEWRGNRSHTGRKPCRPIAGETGERRRKGRIGRQEGNWKTYCIKQIFFSSSTYVKINFLNITK